MPFEMTLLYHLFLSLCFIYFTLLYFPVYLFLFLLLFEGLSLASRSELANLLSLLLPLFGRISFSQPQSLPHHCTFCCGSHGNLEVLKPRFIVFYYAAQLYGSIIVIFSVLFIIVRPMRFAYSSSLKI